MKILFNVIALFIAYTIYAQDLTQSQVIESLSSLRDNIKEYNPALEDYNPNFDQEAARIIESVDKESYSPIEHFKLITELCTISNEGHFAMGSWNDTPHKGFGDDSYEYLPLAVQLINGKIYLWSDLSNENQLVRGDEITKINGKTSSEIIAQLMRYTPSDGGITGYAHRSISSSFNWMYYLYIETPKTFKITYQKLNSDDASMVEIEALKRSELIANYKERSSNSEQNVASVKDVYELQIENDYAILKLKSFYRQLLEKYNLKSKKLYQEIFQSIKEANVSTLIIDLRDNNGGRKEFANDMVPFIMQAESDDPYLRKSVSWDGKEKEIKLPKKAKNSFEGKIITIVNAATFSAAGSLARFLKEYANAIVVGQESGTRYEGFAAGSKQYVNVPYTDVKIGIPRYQTVYPNSKKQPTANRGLIPDHLITYTIQDLIEKKDLEMEYIMENLIR